jgi:hypothetical protein
MQKEFEKQEKIKQLDEENRKKYEQELKTQHEQHNKHDKVHHPGNKAQLEEVWEKQDHMEGEDFNPKTFFMLHDVDSNGFWDETEVKALFVKELDKVYQQGLPEDDMKERAEEMERMREHVFKEADTNHDGLISYQEFIDQTARDEFNRDPGWDTVDNQPQFTHEEYLEFERRRQEEIQRLIADGVLPPHPNMPGGYYQPGQQQQPPYQAHPNEIPHAGVQYQNHPQQQQPYHYQQPQHQQNYQQQQMMQQHQQYQQYQQPIDLNHNQVYQHVEQTQQAAQHPNQNPNQNQQVPQNNQPAVPQSQQPVPQQKPQAVPQQQQPAVPPRQPQVPQQPQQVLPLQQNPAQQPASPPQAAPAPVQTNSAPQQHQQQQIPVGTH